MPAIVPVTGNATYTAQFDENLVTRFARHSLTLNGDIGVNFYLNLTAAEAQNATVDFELNGETLSTDSTLNAATVDGRTYYMASCNVCAPEMADTITATLKIDEEEVESEDYSVKTYGDRFLSDEYKVVYLEKGHTEDEYNKLATLVQTMLNYGAATQVQFADEHPNTVFANEDISYDLVPLNSDELSAINMPAPDKDAINAQLEGTGLTYYGYTMLLHSKTKLRFYFQKDSKDTDISGIQLTRGGTAYNAQNYNDWFCYVEVPEIPAYELNNAFTLSVNGTELGSYSALTYVKDVLTDNTLAEEDPLIYTVTAMYRYHQAAVTYFNN